MSQSLKVATYNLWHGLKPHSKFLFVHLEPKTRLRLRNELQVQLLRSLRLDVIFLQEVNPIWDRSLELSEELGLQSFEQVDLGGVKVFGYGFPLNLHSGLVTLVNPAWSPRWLESIKLSGPPQAKAGTLFTLQWTECRYALLVEALHPVLGKILLVNVHLHNGIEWNSEYLKDIQSWAKRHSITESVYEELIGRFKEHGERRRAELQTLMARLKQLRRKYAALILGGDLNFSPGSSLYEKLLDGDADLTAVNREPMMTWNPDENQANYHFQSQFPLSVLIEDLSFSQSAIEELNAMLKSWQATAQQIDHLFYSSEMKITGEASMLGQGVREDMMPSDHFGLLFDGRVVDSV